MAAAAAVAAAEAADVAEFGDTAKPSHVTAGAVASVAKGVTARGVAAAAGAGVGIGFRDPKNAARQAEVLTQRDYQLSLLEKLTQVKCFYGSLFTWQTTDRGIFTCLSLK